MIYVRFSNLFLLLISFAASWSDSVVIWSEPAREEEVEVNFEAN